MKKERSLTFDEELVFQSLLFLFLQRWARLFFRSYVRKNLCCLMVFNSGICASLRFVGATHRTFALLSDSDMFDGIVLRGEFALGGQPNGAFVSAATSAFFLGLSSEIELFASQAHPYRDSHHCE